MKVTTRNVKFRDENGRMVDSLIIGNGSISDGVGNWLSNNPTAIEGPAASATDAWLDQHPEATTTVQDGAISTAKIADGAVTQAKLDPNINLGVADNSVTTPKLVDHAVTMGKTDFYYSGSLAKSYSWISSYFSTYMRISVKWTEMATILNEFPEKLSIVFEGVTDTYWHSGGQNMSMATTSHTKSIPRAYKTIEVNGVKYGILEFLRSDFDTAYNELKTYVDNGESWKDAQFQVTNSATRVPSDATVYFIAGDVTSELIELDFSTTVISSDFSTAVQAVMSGGSGSSSYDEELAKARLTGKVMINIGDSYTRNMGTLLDEIATKYGMIRDDQGVNNTKVIDHFQSRADTLVADYTTGKAISGTTYTASDVAIITFMGGANDGGGISTFVGDGLHVTDTTKLYGACHYIFKVLLNTFTNAKLIVIAQPSNYNQSVSNFTTDAQAQALGFTSLTELQRMDDYQLSEYVMWNKEKAILDVAKAYSLPSIDMFSNFPTMLNPANRTAYWMDSVHINTAGSKLITDALEKKIVELAVG